MQTHRPSRTPSSRTSKTISPQRPTSPRMHSKRPSLSGPMTWLSRSSSSSSVHHPYTPSKPIRISEPQMTSAFDSVGKRSGPLGAGATVVRTPQEALAGPRHATPTSDLEREPEHEIVEEEEEEQEEEEVQDDSFEERPSSRELPPVPDKDEEDSPRMVGPRSTTPSRPTRPPPPAPEQYQVPSPTTSSPSTPSPRRPSLKVLDSFPPVPALPANLLPSPPQPEFEAILLSTPPPNGTDPNKIIVTVETSTQMFKTTLKTLTSRPSYLSTYLQDLLSAEHDEYRDDRRDSRVSEADSSFHHMFRQHLASSGLLQTSSNIHIFLDRPSAPYAHILSYLRLPPSSSEHPACLPRAAQLLSSSSSRLEALLELRDEARYLDLEELYRLCTEELRSRQSASIGRASMHLRAISNTSVSTSSVRSLGMNAFREVDDVREVEETQEQRRLSGDSGIGSANSHSGRSPRVSLTAEVGWHSTVPSLAQRGHTPSKKSVTMRGKPTGDWI